ncbi:TonB-dependent receptor [uncultured Bacteroides sp.]|uniref:SusC/RagA family TonB-linked outer membrane protein n=1 Tax=uncultured Bacteroides sp. TaxID=162156 RepID=UPI002AA8894C|nr:TonB-dependent receptor [uncultured Bacteroides sp.]
MKSTNHYSRPLGLFLLLCLVPLWALAQTITVKGVVKDASGEPVIGASVLETGTTNGTITDLGGAFNLKVSSKGQLTISFIGYQTQIIRVADKTSFSITLKEDTKVLDEVVVVGYGTMKKLDVSGAIVSTNSQVIREVPSTNVTTALQGRLPGIEMAQTSTRPGATMQVRIRGERSLNATNDPLIVLDGIPFAGSINDIAPSDIKSIDILKDASSTAIYGSRGANGVILITTFRGVAGGMPTVSYNGYYGIKTVAKKYEVYNGEEFQALHHATVNETYKDKYTALEQASIDAGKSTDWQDLMYNNAMVTNHDLSISSGTQKGSYSFGGGFYDETTVLPGQKYTRYSLRTAIDQEIGKYVKVGLSSQNSYGITDGESAGLMNNILTLSPLMPAYNDDGSIRQIPTEGHVDTYYNPLLLKDKDLWQENRKRYATFNSLYGEIKITNNLKYRLNVGLSYYQENYGRYYGSDTPFQNGGVSSAMVQNRHNTVWTVENLLYYDKVFAQKHRLNVTAMYSAEQSEYNQSQMNANDLPADYLFYYNLGLANGEKTINAGDQSYNKRGLLSYMARAQYAYDNRYMLTVTFRSDGSSVLSPGHQWHNYPAISAGWNINNESFMSNFKAISQLKLRFGYGQTSNQSINPYSTLGGLSQVPYNFDSNNQYGYYVSTLPNKNLGWEYTQNYNLGLDFGFLDGRITGYFDYYYQKTKDVLVQVRLPQSSGVSNPMWQNVGSTENKGFEFSVSAQIIQPKNKGDFGWDMDFNIYANHNKLVSLNSGVTQDIGNGLFVGHPINVIYDYKKIGIVQENEAPYLGEYTAGQIKVADIGGGPNGEPDGKITPDGDREILGTFEPDFAGGLSTRLSYKNFDFSIVSFFKSGGLLVSTMHMPQSYMNINNARRNSIKVDYWTPEHPTGTYPQPGNQSTAEINNFGNTLGFFDASFWKVRTISLGYTFDTKFLSPSGCKAARIYITCQNPFTFFSPYMDAGGLDPETTGSGAQAASDGLKSGSGIMDRQLTIGVNTPPTRNFLLGLNLTF